jgi:hypothetical protein
MRRIHLLLATALLAAPCAAMAQNCAGFGDVAASSPFCQNVEWVRNRAVTLGCGDGSNYCPSDPVSRLQMAIFLHRLGTALTPVDLPVAAVPAAVQTPGANPVVCATADYPVTGFPRRAYVNAMATLSAPSASIDVRAAVAYSTNGGASWTPVGNSDQYATLYQPTPPATLPDQATLAPFGSVDLNVGQTVRFGVQLGQIAGGGTVSVACSTRVQVANRNGVSTPFDAAPAAVAERPRGG